MGFSNGQLESSSKSGRGEKGDPGLPGIGFSLTDDGNFDIDSKRLTEVALPIHNNDAATKEYVDRHISSGSVTKKYVDDENTRQDIAINSKAEKTDVLLRDGTQSMLDNLNLNNHNIINLKDASENNEAVTFSQLKSHTDHVQVNYHLQPNMRFFKNFGDNAELSSSNLPPNFNPKDHFFYQHVHYNLYLVAKKGFDNGFGGQAWVSLKMTNDSLKAGIYTVVFEIFTRSAVSPPILSDETLITQVHGDDNYNVITFSHDYNGQYTKAFIQFSSNGQPGEITFQIRYYGSRFRNFLLFLFYSRVIAGKQNTHFNHNLLSVKSTDYSGTILYFEPINMNSQKIVNLSDPTAPKDAANKEYVDDRDAKQDIAINDLSSRKADKTYVDDQDGKQDIAINDISTRKADKTYVDDEIAKIDLSPYFKLDGSRAMTGNLKMNDNKITDLVTQDDVAISDYPNYVKDSKMAVNKLYVNENFLKLKGDDYDLKGKRIKNTEPYGVNTFDTNDLVSKAFVQAEISKLPTDVLKLDGSRAMTGSLQMGDNAITGIRSSSVDDAALTVGGANSTYLPLTGDRGMQGNLDMGGNAIRNIKPFVEDDSSQAAQNAQSNDVINFRYFHGQRGQLKREINDVAAAALNRKNPDPMEDSIDMGNHSIIRLKDPKSSDSFHASNVNYVNRTISDNNAVINSLIEDKVSEAEALNIKANRQDNEFSFVMDDDLFKEDDDDITKVRKVDKDYYDINKATYQFKIKYDSAIGYYSGKLSIDLRPLDLGEYTIAFEMYYGNQVDQDQVVVDAVSDTLNVSRNNTNTFSDHSRTIINFHKSGNIGIIDLDIDLTLKYKSGVTYDAETSMFVVLYGVSGHQNDVDPRTWDRFYTIRNKIVYFEAPIDMGNRQLKGLNDGNENSDAVNVKQLNETEDNIVKYVDGEIAKVNSEIAKENPTINENKNVIELIVKYILSNDSKISLIKDLYFSDSNEGRTPNTYAFVTTGDNTGDFTFYYVFQHSAITNNVMAVHFDIKNTRGVFIFVDKSKVVISRNPTIDEPSLRSFNIPNNSLGKQVLFWIWVKGTVMNIIFSGISAPINVGNAFVDTTIRRVNVEDNPFTKKRGLITKNIYDNTSQAYQLIKEFEKSEGTII